MAIESTSKAEVAGTAEHQLGHGTNMRSTYSKYGQRNGQTRDLVLR